MRPTRFQPISKGMGMRICDQQRPEYFEFASAALKEQFVYGPSTKCLANLSDDGRILAVVIYDRTSDHDCMMHVASDLSKRWLSREFLFWVFSIPFVQWGMRRITTLVRADADAVLKFDDGIGWHREGRLRCAFDDGTDAILLGMLKEECRFLDEVKYGKQGRHKSAE